MADEEEGEGVVTADEENDEGVEEEDVEEGVNGDGRTPEYCGCIKGKRGAPADGKRGSRRRRILHLLCNPNKQKKSDSKEEKKKKMKER